MKKWIYRKNHITTSKKYLNDEILNIKKYLLNKKNSFWILKDKYLNDYFHIYEYWFNFQNFKNFSEYEKYLKQNQNYKKDFDLFMKYKKQNLNWYYFKLNYFNF